MLLVPEVGRRFSAGTCRDDERVQPHMDVDRVDRLTDGQTATVGLGSKDSRLDGKCQTSYRAKDPHGRARKGQSWSKNKKRAQAVPVVAITQRGEDAMMETERDAA